MRIPRIYIEHALRENETLELHQQAAHYIATVLRMKPKRQVILFNGECGEYQATLQEVTKRRVVISVGTFSERKIESPITISLGIALIKFDRFDWLLQKATELGVTSIHPLISEFTETKLAVDKQEKKLAHWHQILISACEQSERTRIPSLAEPQTFDNWLMDRQEDKRFIMHPYQQQERSQLNDNTPCQSIALAVGPEGGFTEEEVNQATIQGFQPMMLGPRILRAETAPLAAISLLQARYGDFDW